MKNTAFTQERAWLEVNINNLRHNAAVLQKAMPQGCQLMAVVKCRAYGHGDALVARELNQAGVHAFAVATIDEGIALRAQGVEGEILILGYTSINRAKELAQYDLTQTLISADYACALNAQGVPVKAHMKIDTGMHRLGLAWYAFAEAKQLFFLKSLTITGIFTHLCCADSQAPRDVAFTQEQIANFYSFVAALQASGIPIPKLHIQSSYGFLNYPHLKCDYVRAGIALYGVPSAPGTATVRKLDLRPVLSLKSSVILLRSVKKGESLGYGRDFTAQRDSRIAIVPIGYGDGYPRSLSCGRGTIKIRRQQAPIAGRVCMDQLAIDVTDIKDAAIGDIVTLIGGEETSPQSAPKLAAASQSISNELLCRLGTRLPQIPVF